MGQSGRVRHVEPRLDPDVIIELTALGLQDSGAPSAEAPATAKAGGSRGNTDYDAPPMGDAYYEKQLEALKQVRTSITVKISEH